MNVKQLKGLLNKYDENLEIESSKDNRNMLFLLNENESCKATILLKNDEMEKLGYKKRNHIYSIKKSCKRFYLKDENIENDIHIFNDEIEITQKNHNFIGPDQTVTITKEELKAILKVMKEGF